MCILCKVCVTNGTVQRQNNGLVIVNVFELLLETGSISEEKTVAPKCGPQKKKRVHLIFQPITHRSDFTVDETR